MRDMILQALKTKLLGQMNGHIANIEVMMTNPVGVGDHPTIVETIEKELGALDSVNGKLNVLVKYIERPATKEEPKEIKDKSFQENFIIEVLEFISEKKLRVVPTSPEIARFVRSNRRYKELLPVGIKL